MLLHISTKEDNQKQEFNQLFRAFIVTEELVIGMPNMPIESDKIICARAHLANTTRVDPDFTNWRRRPPKREVFITDMSIFDNLSCLPTVY